MQKTLMLIITGRYRYMPKAPHRQDIDALFLQIDELRNIIRRNI
jgi:hypothetical protein